MHRTVELVSLGGGGSVSGAVYVYICQGFDGGQQSNKAIADLKEIECISELILCRVSVVHFIP